MAKSWASSIVSNPPEISVFPPVIFCLIKGDEKIKCISAASVIAKTYRDLLMIKLSKKFKNYAWERNFGYGTKLHMENLKKFGITAHHRKGFKPVHKMLFE